MDAGIGSRIKQLRIAKEMSQADLAKELGVSLRTIGNWEKSGRVPADRVNRLADVLGDDEDQTDYQAPLITAIDYRGWKLTFQVAADATPDRIRRAEKKFLEAAPALLQEMGIDEPE